MATRCVASNRGDHTQKALEVMRAIVKLEEVVSRHRVDIIQKAQEVMRATVKLEQVQCPGSK